MSRLTALICRHTYSHINILILQRNLSLPSTRYPEDEGDTFLLKLVSIYKTTRRDNPGDYDLHIHRRETFRSHTITMFSDAIQPTQLIIYFLVDWLIDWFKANSYALVNIFSQMKPQLQNEKLNLPNFCSGIFSTSQTYNVLRLQAFLHDSAIRTSFMQIGCESEVGTKREEPLYYAPYLIHFSRLSVVSPGSKQNNKT
jgi:hypothetical protein